MENTNNILPQIDNDNVEYNENPSAQNRNSQYTKTHNLICFWVIGLCNNFGGTVMISATFDIIRGLNGVSV